MVEDVVTNPHAVGLLFAGSSTFAFANPINEVLTFLGATVVGAPKVSWSIAGSGDFNGDGHAVILWHSTCTGERVVWIMYGTTLQYGVYLPTEPTQWSIAGSGDFNRDGNADILWQNTSTGQRLVWIMNGTTLQYGVNLPTKPTDWNIPGSGDFNGDGNEDIHWQRTSPGERLTCIIND